MPGICITFSWLSPVEHLCPAAQHGKHAARAYLDKEACLPPAEQISDPPLATMQAHLATLQTGLTECTSGRDQREMHVEVRDTAVTQLLNLLKIAAAIRVAITHNGVPTH